MVARLEDWVVMGLVDWAEVGMGLEMEEGGCVKRQNKVRKFMSVITTQFFWPLR